MCSNFYPTLDPQRLNGFALGLPADWENLMHCPHIFNHKLAPIIRLNPERMVEHIALLLYLPRALGDVAALR